MRSSGFWMPLASTDVTLVVQDWGGPIGIWAALERPARVGRLVIANTWAWPVAGDRHFEMFSAAMGGPPGRWLTERANLFVRLMIPRGHRLRKVTSAEMAHYRAALATPARRRASAIFPRQIIAGQAFLTGIAARLGELADLPALIIWGDADIAFRDTELHRWEALLSDHETVVVFGAGHYVQSDAPAVFAHVLEDWLGPRVERTHA